MKRSVRLTAAVVAFLALLWLASGAAAQSQETSSTISSGEKGLESSLLDTIRKDAEGVEYFSLRFFLRMYEELELEQFDFNGRYIITESDGVSLSVTYERFRAYYAFYEAALRATRAEIVDCLNSYSELSLKEQAFVLAATSLYILRSESPAAVEAAPKEERAEPLSREEKDVFAQFVQDCFGDQRIAFEGIEGSREEWEASLRRNAFEFQKYIGNRNPFYVFSDETEALWRSVCDEAPSIILYSILATETRLDLDDLDVLPYEFDASETGEIARREAKIMKYYLHLLLGLSFRDPGFLQSGIGPRPRIEKGIPDRRMNDIASEIMQRFPNMKTGDFRIAPFIPQ